MNMPIRRGADVPLIALCLTFGAVILPSACAEQSQATLGRQEPESNAFVPTDASVDPDASSPLEYCPTDQCPAGYTTCPLSNFRCDVDFLTDPNNCGACGVVCPRMGSGATVFTCNAGTCVMGCPLDYGMGDCDGMIDNGCETALGTDDNCSMCGDKCPVGKPCIQSIDGFSCGCPPGKIYCPEDLSPLGPCVDPTQSDNCCGGRGNACDPSGGPPVDNGYWGCSESECGKLKCLQYFGNCDGDAQNGCETMVVTHENCGTCGLTAPPGMECRALQAGWAPPKPMPLCPEGLTFCKRGEFFDLGAGNCHDLAWDSLNCGGCDNPCPNVPHGSGICEYGVCTPRCIDGWADCNGAEEDGCETNTSSDPNNCGGCGVRCNSVAGQVCIRGSCAVAPCDADGGVVAR